MVRSHIHRLALTDHQGLVGEWTCSGQVTAERASSQHDDFKMHGVRKGAPEAKQIRQRAC